MSNTFYEFQPVREVFMALALGFMLVAAGHYVWSGAPVEPIVYLETSLILVIAAEAYAKDL